MSGEQDKPRSILPTHLLQQLLQTLTRLVSLAEDRYTLLMSNGECTVGLTWGEGS